MKPITFAQLNANPGLLAELQATTLVAELSKKSGFMDHFYLTGYEALCLRASHSELTRSIISSAVPIDAELLVVGHTTQCDEWRHACAELRIHVTALDLAETASIAELTEATEAILEANHRISHILADTAAGQQTIEALATIAHRAHRGMIADNSSAAISIADLEAANVDFTIADTTVSDIALVVARRSRLVMTEGNARQADHDIYAAWQNTLAARNPTWAPMA